MTSTAHIYPEEERSGDKGAKINGGAHTANAKAPRLKLIPWSEMHLLPKREALIEGLLDRGSMALVYGASGSGKTFFALDLSAHVALNWEWRGKAVNQGSVVYIAAEGGLGLEERLTAFRQHHETDAKGVPLYVIPEPIDLCRSPGDTKLLLERLSGLADIVLIVIDTLSRAMSGGNENSSDDMGAFVRYCDQLRMATGASVLIIHHAGKDDSRGARGHSLLKAAADTEIEVTSSEASGLHTATVTKQRDYRGGEALAFRLEQIELTDRTACVLVPSEAVPPKTTGAKLTANQQSMLNILDDAGAAGLTVEEWNDTARENGIGTHRRGTLMDCRKALKDKKLIHTYADRWYVTR